MDSASYNQEDNSMKKAHTLVRRVSDLFRDGSCSGPHSLFSQKLRHCCENLNLYVLYSIGRSESHLAKKVNLCLELILQNLLHQVFFLCTSLRRAVLYYFQKKSLLSLKNEVAQDELAARNEELEGELSSSSSSSVSSDEDSESRKTQFLRLQKQEEPEKHSPLLLAAIYFAPIMITLQLIWVSSFLFFGEYSPGFVFLLSALSLLGCILTKIMFHEQPTEKPKSHERRGKSRQKRKE